VNLRPLDPQHIAVDVSAGQSAHGARCTVPMRSRCAGACMPCSPKVVPAKKSLIGVEG
jgi:hypothetical protein